MEAVAALREYIPPQALVLTMLVLLFWRIRQVESALRHIEDRLDNGITTKLTEIETRCNERCGRIERVESTVRNLQRG